MSNNCSSFSADHTTNIMYILLCFLLYQQHPSPTPPSTGYLCSLPRDEGPCETWTVRFCYNPATAKCTEFWYGGCQGNPNNFVSLEACQRECGGVARVPVSTSPRETTRRATLRDLLRARP